MSTVDEIKSALPNLSIKELYWIERSIHELYRQRNQNIIYDDAYGVWTEEDQASAGAQVFAFIDNQEGTGKDANT